MNLSIAIVGFPNVGKSTLFNALLKKQQALAANYPFATIEPNVGIVPVEDSILDQLAITIEKSEGELPPIKPATVQFVDIAGLVKGASAGEGLGNQFLSHIRETSAIVHVLRAFETEDVVRAGAVSPLDDYQTIQTELILADLTTLEKQKEPKGGADKDAVAKWTIVSRLKQELDAGKPARVVITDPADLHRVRDLHLLTLKPELFLINLDENTLSRREEQESRLAQELGVSPEEVLGVSALLESQLASLEPEEQRMFLEEYGLDRSGLERVIQAGYRVLGLQSFYTAGKKEVRAWTIPNGTTAPKAAGVIHTDFEKHFIRSLTISAKDFIALGGWKTAKEAGKVRQEGKEYVMQEQDVVEFLIGS